MLKIFKLIVKIQFKPEFSFFEIMSIAVAVNLIEKNYFWIGVAVVVLSPFVSSIIWSCIVSKWVTNDKR